MPEYYSGGEEDRALLLRLRSTEDSEGAFREIFNRFHRRLLGFFKSRGFDAEICRELSQETFLRVYRGRGDFRAEVPLAAWIFQIANHIGKNELRRRHAGKRSGREESLDDDETSPLLEVHTGGHSSPSTKVAEPLARTLAREQVEALGQVLEQLPPKMRRVVQMSVLQERSVAQIATLLKISESTVKVHLHQARKRLREALADRFGELAF